MELFKDIRKRLTDLTPSEKAQKAATDKKRSERQAAAKAAKTKKLADYNANRRVPVQSVPKKAVKGQRSYVRGK